MCASIRRYRMRTEPLRMPEYPERGLDRCRRQMPGSGGRRYPVQTGRTGADGRRQ